MEFKLLSWNINFSTRTEGEYEDFDWKHRQKLVISEIQRFINEMPTVACFQEVMPDSEVDLKLLFEDTHQVFKQQTHPVGRSVLTFVPKEIEARQMTIPNLGSVDSAKQGQTYRDPFLGVILGDQTRNNSIFLVNAHLPMGKEYRQVFSTQIADILSFERRPTKGVILCGDFNTFPDDWGPEQSALIQTRGNLHDTTSFIFNPDKTKRVLKTFHPYPYDKVPDVEPYNLDHIYVSNVSHDIPIAWEFKNLQWNKKNYGISDHSALTMTCQGITA